MNYLLTMLVWGSLSGSVCLLRKNNGLVDIFWGLGFVFLAITGFFTNTAPTLPSQLLTVLILFWGLRLSIYLFSRNWNKPEDFRYANWRKEWGDRWVLYSILKVYLLQGLIMCVIATPIFVVNASDTTTEAAPLLVLFGAVIAFSGVIIEGVADAQKSKFKKTAKSPIEICKVGLWSISRHPNYLGEIIFWIGIAALTLSVKNGFLGLISPLAMTFLLYRVSGVPFLEERWVGRPDFEDYKKTTGAIFPKFF